jgi:hypothetical protein
MSQFPQTFLTNPSKLRIYLCKIPTVMTETQMCKQGLIQSQINSWVSQSTVMQQMVMNVQLRDESFHSKY